MIKDLFDQCGAPEISKSDQDNQYTSENWLNCLKSNNVKVGIDCKGRAINNIFIECCWRSLKYD